MEPTAEVRIGGQEWSHLIIAVTRRERPDADDCSDGNWVCATVTIASGAFRGSFEAALRAEELAAFRDEVRKLRGELDGKAWFSTAEGWLGIAIAGDGRGHFRAACEATDMPGLGGKLAFVIELDQTHLGAMVSGLEGICAAFPVKGSAR